MIQTNHIRLRLNSIYRELTESAADFPSLLTGTAGINLFFYYYSRHFPEQCSETDLNARISNYIDNSFRPMSPSFCDGEAGKYSFFYFLSQAGYLSADDMEFLCDKDDELKNASLTMMQAGNYDPLHGALSVAHYFLYTQRYTDADRQTYFDSLFDHLLNVCKQSRFGLLPPYLDLETYTLDEYKLSMGLAHGLPGVLKCCMQACRQGLAADKAKLLADHIIGFILSNLQHDQASYLPNFKTIGDNTPEMSRLGWCYGDPGAAFILYQAALYFDRTLLRDKAIEILLFNSLRKEPSQTAIADASLCHGTAGTAFLFQKMYRYTGLQEFNSAASYWINQTIAWARFDDAVSGYKYYYTPKKKYVHDNSLLNGSAGIGLALISSMTGDDSWDFCLLLND